MRSLSLHANMWCLNRQLRNTHKADNDMFGIQLSYCKIDRISDVMNIECLIRKEEEPVDWFLGKRTI